MKIFLIALSLFISASDAPLAQLNLNYIKMSADDRLLFRLDFDSNEITEGDTIIQNRNEFSHVIPAYGTGMGISALKEYSHNHIVLKYIRAISYLDLLSQQGEAATIFEKNPLIKVVTINSRIDYPKRKKTVVDKFGNSEEISIPEETITYLSASISRETYNKLNQKYITDLLFMVAQEMNTNYSNYTNELIIFGNKLLNYSLNPEYY